MSVDYSFENFKKNVIIRAIGLDKYDYLKNNLYACDVSKNDDFQRTFNAFYRVRRNEEWRNIFYTYFESIKNKKNITFEEILSYLYQKTGNIEASFSSKLLSTINSDMPIWDQFVLSELRLKVKGETKEEKFKNTICVYKEIIEEENKKLKENDIQKSIKEFKKYFSEYKLSDIKILDYILWSIRN